ncbi:ABC transporter ATP-binding protein [Nitratireductor soli]|uniref:ABC transporter ATP-binding protein n=1 Tax=Nitratireductor soli TaxID=1670619 RepID=UPI00065DEADF|nr:ABC transporter ATP-binding protein [Nitratireductor soli]
MAESMVRLQRACKAFPLPEGGTVTALDAIDLEVARNEFLTLLGPSGCGKTTLLHAISGFVELDDGRIFVDGEDVSDRPPHRRPVNTVFQNYALFPHMTVGQNVGYALDIARTPRTERSGRVGAALEMVGLAGLENRLPRQLSGGQQQRVALARAIIARPKLLLLDEPLSALDRKLRQSMQIELKTLQAELGISFIFVTHDQEEALTMSNRVAVLDGGSIQQIDTPRAVYNNPANAFVASFVGASNLFQGMLQSGRVMTAQGDVISTDAAAAGSARVTALLRPEQFTIANGGGNGAAAKLDIGIRQIVFTGAGYEVHGRTMNGHDVVAAIAAAQQAQVASAEISRKATLLYDPAAVHIIAGGGDRS